MEEHKTSNLGAVVSYFIGHQLVGRDILNDLKPLTGLDVQSLDKNLCVHMQDASCELQTRFTVIAGWNTDPKRVGTFSSSPQESEKQDFCPVALVSVRNIVVLLCFAASHLKGFRWPHVMRQMFA